MAYAQGACRYREFWKKLITLFACDYTKREPSMAFHTPTESAHCLNCFFLSCSSRLLWWAWLTAPLVTQTAFRCCLFFNFFSNGLLKSHIRTPWPFPSCGSEILQAVYQLTKHGPLFWPGLQAKSHYENTLMTWSLQTVLKCRGGGSCSVRVVNYLSSSINFSLGFAGCFQGEVNRESRKQPCCQMRINSENLSS